MSFAQPLLLWGLLAIAVPLAIHFLLRPRPRSVAFPPLSLLRQALAQGRRAQRVRNLWLLLWRSALIALLALLLAQPTCRPRRAIATPTGGPTARVVILDDSASMRQTLSGRQTWYTRAVGKAGDLLAFDRERDERAFVRASMPETAEWVTEFPRLQPQLSAARQTPPTAATLGPALRKALALFAAAPPDLARELVIITDAAEHAWRDVPPRLLQTVNPPPRVVIAPPADRPRTDLAVRSVSLLSWLAVAQRPTDLNVSLAAARLPVDASVVVEAPDGIRARRDDLRVRADSEESVALRIPALPLGAHPLRVQAAPRDRLLFDQQRYAVLRVHSRPRVWLIRAAVDDEDLTGVLLETLLDPPGLPDEERRLDFMAVARSQLPAALREAEQQPPALVIVLGGVDVAEAQRTALAELADNGTRVLLIPSSDPRRASFGALDTWFSDAPLQVEPLPAVETMRWRDESALGAGRRGMRELTRANVIRRLRIAQPARDAAVIAEYGDRRPALLRQSLGPGAAYLLTTSPDPEWSELGSRAVGLLALTTELAGRAAAGANPVLTLEVGQSSRAPLPGLIADGLAQVSPVFAEQRDLGERSAFHRLERGVPVEPWPSAFPGVYAVSLAGRMGFYVVNFPPAESDLTEMDTAAMESRLAATLEILRPDGDAPNEPTLLAWISDVEAARAIPVVLALVLVGELILANRRSTPQTGADEAVSA